MVTRVRVRTPHPDLLLGSHRPLRSLLHLGFDDFWYAQLKLWNDTRRLSDEGGVVAGVLDIQIPSEYASQLITRCQ